ncbi:polyprenol monophosphomannose synthase [bacterium]|nr:polyprenol monophosphomannose synthase [bacterium]
MCIIIPTYNEKDNIIALVPKVLAKDELIDILVIDDNSPDGTAAEVKKMAEKNDRLLLIEREKKLGLGTAYVCGFKFVLDAGYDIIFEMDADFSHNPKAIPEFIKAIKDNDLVVGSRYISGVNVVNWPMMRLLLSWSANLYTRIVTGMPLRDATSGFKCFRREILAKINLNQIHSDGYAFQIEMHYKAWKLGARILELPIIFIDRTVGESKMHAGIIKEAAWMVWKLRLLSLFGRL